QFPVIVTARHCVIDTAADIPLYEFVGITTPLDDDDLQCTGDYNRYTDEEVTFLRVRSSTPGEASQDYQLRSRWSNETHHQPGVRWLNPAAWPLPAHAITKHDFAIDPTFGDAGFGSAQLPEIYARPS